MSDRDPDKLHPELQQKLRELQDIMAYLGHPIFITDGWRSSQEQARLYALGRTAPGSIVTNAAPGRSLHEKTRNGQPCSWAVDVAFAPINGLGPYEGRPWQLMGEVATWCCGLKWGGRWKTQDRPHLYIEPDEGVRV